MRNILALVGATIVFFVGVGWYLDWYNISRQPSPDGSTQRLQVDINTKQILKDGQTAMERGGELLEKLQQGDGTPNSPVPASLPGPNRANGQPAVNPMVPPMTNPMVPPAVDSTPRRPFSKLPTDPQYNNPQR